MKARNFRLALVALGGALILLQLLGLYLQSAGDYDGVISVGLGQGAIYLVAVFCVMRHGANTRDLLWLILAVAAILRVVTVGFSPYLSSDIYRYVWDGEVQGAGINPYHYVPADDNLKELRDSAIYPNINRANYARTIYPPAAQLIFLAVTRISPTVLAMKIAMLVFELATIFLLLRLLKELRAPPCHIAIYGWHPLAVWEIAGSGHIDAAIAAFVTVALLASYRKAPFIAGTFLALAALVKFLPIIIVPALYRRWDWRLPAALAATIVCLYLPYLSVGRDVLGFLPAYIERGAPCHRRRIFHRQLAVVRHRLDVPPGLSCGGAVAAGGPRRACRAGCRESRLDAPARLVSMAGDGPAYPDDAALPLVLPLAVCRCSAWRPAGLCSF